MDITRALVGLSGSARARYPHGSRKNLLAFPSRGWRAASVFSSSSIPRGRGLTSQVQSSTLGNPGVEQCIAGAVRRWEFPRPLGGIVAVTYPFVLKSDGK
jgi:hypothetical protein